MGIDNEIMEVNSEAEGRPCQLSRRRFLQAAGVGGATVAMLTIPGCGTMLAKTTPLPSQRVASLADLKVDRPMTITYPDPGSTCMLVKLGTPAGGGIGPDEDIVAFSLACPHMGMTLLGSYNAEHKGLGPCPSHLTRFDLTRYGIVISGHATESLPQVMLEVEANGEIYATGIRGLVYGRTSNLG
ncbi:MAG: arsenate reductase (azurin) small subunit [bacterium]|nr:arsenate reductase (azurin) small subunit [Deltaproteobacteria bacterium]MCP4908501.1 arsenate reductase (azurin) small subunit [bacterium]